MVVQLLFWIGLSPIANLTGWVNEPWFISELSLAAMILAAGTLLYSASIECQRVEEDVASEVVEKIVEETDVSEASPSPLVSRAR